VITDDGRRKSDTFKVQGSKFKVFLGLVVFFLTLNIELLNFEPRVAYAAVGDTITCGTTLSSVAAGAALDIQPGAGAEWAIATIWFEFDVEIQRFDGTTPMPGVQYLGPNYQNFFPMTNVTNANRIRIKNLHGTVAKLICFDGVVTK